MSEWRIVRDDLTHPDVVALLDLHLRAAVDNSPPGSVFALDLAGLRVPALRLWSVWEGETLLGIGALKALGTCEGGGEGGEEGGGDSGEEGEVKSMRTAPGQQRRGVARALLAHLIAEARASGWSMLRLETGGNDAFAAARALYAGAGFCPAEAFGAYVLTDFNRCYALPL